MKTSPDIKRSYVRMIYNQSLQNKSFSKCPEHFTQIASIIRLLQARFNKIQSTHGKSKDCTLSNLRPYKMNSPPTDATKCDTSLHPTLLSGTSVSFCRGLVLWWLHVRHAHVCICFLSNCRCNKKIGGTWRCLKVTSAILQTTSPDLTCIFCEIH